MRLSKLGYTCDVTRDYTRMCVMGTVPNYIEFTATGLFSEL